MLTTYAPLAKRLPSWIYKIGAQLFIKKDFPRHLFIETTASCNLSCSYCPREKNDDSMDFGLFRKIIDEATRFGPRSFSLHLFGEPLLYPRIFEACSYIKWRNPNHVILLTTNGTKINECINDLISSGVDQVLWTWRPEARFRESTLLKLRGWGKFRVRFIKEITPERAYKQWEDWPNVEGRKLHNYGGEIKTESFKRKESGLETKTMTPRLQSLKFLKKIFLGQKKNQKRWPCYHLWLAPAVAWNGQILICCADPHRKEVIGNFPGNSVSSAWRGQKFQGIRRSHLEGRYEGICKTCDVWKQYPDIFFSWQKIKSS